MLLELLLLAAPHGTPLPSAAHTPAADALATVCFVHHSTEVIRRAYGFDHIVHISNGCEVAVACTVRTSANQAETSVTVRGGTRVSVLTQRGSPSSKFSAAVYCKKV